MVMEFVAAPPWSESQLLSNAGIDALGSVLRRVHDLACPGLPQVDVALVAQDYCNAIAQCLPGSAAKAAAELAAIQRDTREIASLSQRAVLNHGDLMASNLLGDPPMLVDWEYAQRTDPTWDVACLLAYYPSLESRLDRLLAACELATRDDRQILSLQQRQFTRLNCLWQKLQVRN
jgi:thiamine kinase-like enzyme